MLNCVRLYIEVKVLKKMFELRGLPVERSTSLLGTSATDNISTVISRQSFRKEEGIGRSSLYLYPLIKGYSSFI